MEALEPKGQPAMATPTTEEDTRQQVSMLSSELNIEGNMARGCRTKCAPTTSSCRTHTCRSI